MSTSAIEWTESTWNPVTGCTRVSAGCAHCYAERMARRLQAIEQAAGVTNGKYQNGFNVTLHQDELARPKAWRKPQRIFVNSMSDLFHERIPRGFILRVFRVMLDADQHLYQILTKRSRRLRELDPHLRWAEHIWMGVTVERADYVFRIDDLRATHAHVKFLSLEPLLGPLPGLNLRGIDWVIVGGESGPGARPMREEWVLDIQWQCRRARVPFFFKQWGGVHKKKSGRLLQGRTWDEMPGLAMA
jgi:protein gp37